MHVAPPGVAVTVYVDAAPPDPAVTDTVAKPSPAMAVGAPGTPGGVIIGVADVDARELPDEPVAFVATAVNVYARALTRPVTTHDVAGAVIVHVLPFSTAVTSHDTSAPPLPSTTVTVARASPAIAVGAAGVLGRATGVIEADAALAADVEFGLVAVAVKVYGVPFVSPTTVHVSDEPGFDTTQVFDSGDDVTVYDVTAPPPAPGTTVTDADASRVCTDGWPGTVGAAIGVTLFDASPSADVVFAFVADALNV